jgi:hypothetical protein
MTLAIVGILLLTCANLMIAWLSMSVSQKTAQMSAVATISNRAITALINSRFDVDAATRDVLADLDHTARDILMRREGANFDAWVRNLVRQHAEQVPK